MDDFEIEAFINTLQIWHKNQVEQLRQVLENKDSDIHLGDMVFPSDSDAAKGIRAGIKVSLELLGELPFTVTKNEQQEEDDE